MVLLVKLVGVISMEKSNFLFIVWLCIVYCPFEYSSYLWEMRNEEGRSCCLHFCTIDIANPYVPCTGFAKKDLSGILDYLYRLLQTDHAKTESHYTMLTQVKQYIRSILHNPYGTIGYRREYRSVQFYHDILDAAILKNKDVKKETLQPKAKETKEDLIAQHLIKLGLMVKHPKK